jgi:hypothetical protein
MSMFNLSEVKEEVKGGANETYIYPGIRNNVKIKKWTNGSTPNGTPFLAVHLVTREGEEANVEATEFPFYTSEKALKTSLAKIKHIVTKVATEAEWLSKEPADMDEMTDHLNDISRGKYLRIKFTGEEYQNKNGEIKEKALIGLPEFAEAIENGAEYPVVAPEESKLVFDKNNSYDFKKFVPENVTANTPVQAKVTAW